MNNSDLIKSALREINKYSSKEITIMEVCGTHTQAIAKFGIGSLLNDNIRLVSGPGCPLCVTDESYIDKAILLLKSHDVILVSFGDLMKVHGSKGNLLDEKAKGKNIRVVYSPMEALKLAQKYPNKKIVFLGIGFETTAPLIGLTVKTAKKLNIHNLFFLTALKTMDSILHLILKEENSYIDGIICPGHVASIKGSQYFSFIYDEYGIPSLVCGFEELDIISGIYTIVQQCFGRVKKSFYNLYRRCVREGGNPIAKEILWEVFSTEAEIWRGIGLVPKSALVLNKGYESFDAAKAFNLNMERNISESRCHCKEILLGYKTPRECSFFGRECKPQSPIGPSMVSQEGACSIQYRYGSGGENE